MVGGVFGCCAARRECGRQLEIVFGVPSRIGFDGEAEFLSARGQPAERGSASDPPRLIEERHTGQKCGNGKPHRPGARVCGINGVVVSWRRSRTHS